MKCGEYPQITQITPIMSKNEENHNRRNLWIDFVLTLETPEPAQHTSRSHQLPNSLRRQLSRSTD